MTGIIVGRFQTPYLHAGHLHLIATALRECEKVVILLGCTVDYSGEYDDRNPYSASERIMMLKRIFPQLDIIPLYDHPSSDESWSRQLDQLASGYNAPLLYHSRDSYEAYYTTQRYARRVVEEIEGYSATKIRESLKNQ